MSKSFSYPNKGTCSKETHIVLNDDHTIESIEVIGGCNGNLKGISRLLKGWGPLACKIQLKRLSPWESWRVSD